MSNNPRNVRQRTGDDEASRISDLPIGFLVNVSEYLPKPSKAMLAVALSAPSSSWNVNSIPSNVSKAIVSASQWDTLDFEDVNKELANKLTDDDISAVLICIDAHDVLKKLKLCGCINIIGHGLSPLRGSSILEQIDISLAGKDEEPQIEPIPRISHEIVLPILDGIISSDRCTLKYIQLPWKWRETPPVIEFKRRYNQHLDTRGFSCSKCNRNMNTQDWFENTMICYECLKPICSQCDMDGRAAICRNCIKKYCDDCVYMTECDECEEAICENCYKVCVGCSRSGCESCIEMLRCEGMNCSYENCEDCQYKEDSSVRSCADCSCGTCFCNYCKVIEGKRDASSVCDTCIVGLFPFSIIEEQEEELAQLRKENEELAKDNQELKKKVESMSL